MENFYKTWNKVIENCVDTLSLLRSSDFGPKNAMNEVSLKAIVIQQIKFHFKNKLKIVSEQYIKVPTKNKESEIDIEFAKLSIDDENDSKKKNIKISNKHKKSFTLSSTREIEDLTTKYPWIQNSVSFENEKNNKEKESTRFIDIFLVDKETNTAFIVELKYIRLTYLMINNRQNFISQGSFEHRRVLKDALERFNELQQNDILKLRKFEMTPKKPTIRKIIESAMNQAIEYSTAKSFEMYENVYAIACVGVVNKMFLSMRKLK